MTYDEYLASPEWQEKRQARLELDGFQCQFCGSENDLCVHHVTYDRLGNEDVNFDLVTLCKDCHERLHQQKVASNDRKTKAYEKFANTLKDCDQFQKALAEYHMECDRADAETLIAFDCCRCTTAEKEKRNIVFRTLDFSLNHYATDFFWSKSIRNPGGFKNAKFILARILQGKKKAGQPNTTKDWASAYLASYLKP